MLFDPKWEAGTKADPLSLAGLIAWLEKQPADRSYNYDCTGSCLIAQYLTAQGFAIYSVGPFDFYFGEAPNLQMHPLPADFNSIALASRNMFGGASLAMTFGAALDRARALARAV